jgi:hypothetical protein
MKIAITGHTSGIGKTLTELCDHKKIEWDGFSRSNGFDITSETFQTRLPEIVEDYDVFINNAYVNYTQVDLLYRLWEHWKFLDKQIVCISSASPDVIKPFEWPYSIHKGALDKACAQLCNISDSNCRVTNIKPGWVNTPMSAGYPEYKKLDPHYVAEVIIWCITQPVYLESLTIQPRHAVYDHVKQFDPSGFRFTK